MNHIYDIIIIGGGISGSLCAFEIKSQKPKLRICIIEQSEKFFKKVGESTSDIPAIYFRRSKFLHLCDKQIKKTGLRFWFHPNVDHSLNRFLEFSSPSYKSIANGFQLNRAEFDEDLLLECKKIGIELIRPALVENIEMNKFSNIIDINIQNQKMQLKSTWLIDCSGRKRLIGNQKKWLVENLNHQTAASWAHFINLKPMDSWDLKKHPILDEHTISPRYNVTGHFVRHGLWWWHIPLNDNTISLGVVYDKEIYPDKNPKDFFKELIDNDIALRELTANAEFKQFYHFPQLSYLPSNLYSPGQLTIGDSSGFIDPLFSPGIEMTIQQTLWIANIFKNNDLNSTAIEDDFKKYEKIFLKSFQDRSFSYEDRYKVFAYFDIFSVWTQMDFSGYYFFHVFPTVVFPSHIRRPIIFKGVLKLIYHFFKWRYLSIASWRRENNIMTSSFSSDLVFSRISVPSGLKLLLKYPELLLTWGGRYLKLEFFHLIGKILTKFQRSLK